MAGAVTYAMAPWDLTHHCVDANHKLMSLKVGTIAPHPSIPSKCIMTTLETNYFGGMPTWALHLLTRATAPQLMKSLESRYIANVRARGDVMDITPEGEAYQAAKHHK